MVNRIIKWIIILLVLSALTGHLSAMLDSNSQRTIRAVLSDVYTFDDQTLFFKRIKKIEIHNMN